MAARVVGLFPGQGSQWVGMGRQLLTESTGFGHAIAQVDAIVGPRLNWTVAEELAADEEHSRLGGILALQVTLFAVEVGLAAVWAERGVHFDSVAGTSLGELAAVQVAGILNLTDALDVVIARSELLEHHRPEGGTIVVNVDASEADQLLEDLPAPAYIAGFNGPGTTTFSGHEAALVELLRRGEQRGVFAARVRVEYPAHSPLLNLVGEGLRARLHHLRPSAGTIPFYSAVTGTRLEGTTLDADYWARNLTAAVYGQQMLDQLLADGHDVILEVTPHPIFAKPTQDAIAARDGALDENVTAIHCPTLRRNKDAQECLAAATQQLLAAGVQLAH
ncbi:MAG: acyltransferase domain-containing protein [Actinomycetota bacterium]|nr:acyltransferase domain-containing protein [Actinomycetota bacterium]